LFLVREVADLVDGTVGTESKEVFPDGDTAKRSFSVEVAADVEVVEVVEMFPNLNLGFIIEVALLARIVIVENVAFKPASIVYLIDSGLRNSEVGLVELLSRNDLFVGVRDCHLHCV
jgi:hypothetical protein